MICLLAKQIKTKNIGASLDKIIKENNLKNIELSFNIDNVDTYIKTVFENEYILYNEDIKGYYLDHQKMVDEHVELKQAYIITIKDEKTSDLVLKYAIDFSQDNIHPSIIISPQSQIPYARYQPKEIYALLMQELNNIKAKNRMLIKIFDEEMREKVKMFVKYLYHGKFSKNIKIPLFNGIDPKNGQSGRLITHFLQKQDDLQFIEVDKDEILVEYIKPIHGKKGFNAFGEIIDSNFSITKHDLECKIDNNSIEVIEEDKRKLYKSKLKGYVHLDKENFYVDNKIKMAQLSRVQNKVVKDEANNIEVIISQNDTNLDSVGEGVELISETIHINGHVGAKAIIRTVNLTIDGATHQSSYQEAKFATINRHKGKLRCHNAKINLLEGGEVHATNVEIQDSLGGTIYAENVTIGRVKNNLKVFASSSIVIKNVSGENNIFKINYKDIPTLVSKYNYIQRDLEDLRYKLDGAKKHSLSQVPILTNQINETKARLAKITNSAKEAKITIHDKFHGINTISFVLDNNEELVYKTDEKAYEPFYLVETDNYITLHPTNKKIAITSK